MVNALDTRYEMVSNLQELKIAIEPDIKSNGNLSLCGVARLCDVDSGSILKGDVFNSVSLTALMTDNNISPVGLRQRGFPPKATVLVMKYFIEYSRAKATFAHKFVKAFGYQAIKDLLTELKRNRFNIGASPLSTPIPTQVELELPEPKEKIKIDNDPFAIYEELIKKLSDVEENIKDRRSAKQICDLIVQDFVKNSSSFSG